MDQDASATLEDHDGDNTEDVDSMGQYEVQSRENGIGGESEETALTGADETVPEDDGTTSTGFADENIEAGNEDDMPDSTNDSVVLPAYVTEQETATVTAGEEQEVVAGVIPNAPSYSAPEDEQHVRVSFHFEEASTSAYFSDLTYPLTLRLKEVDTGRKLTLTIKSDGQILEVEKGDYSVQSLKDSGKVPLTVAGDILHLYQNTEYPVRFSANNGLKMFMDFLADNVLLVVFFVFAALFYKAVIIPRFASDIRRH